MYIRFIQSIINNKRDNFSSNLQVILDQFQREIKTFISRLIYLYLKNEKVISLRASNFISLLETVNQIRRFFKSSYSQGYQILPKK